MTFNSLTCSILLAVAVAVAACGSVDSSAVDAVPGDDASEPDADPTGDHNPPALVSVSPDDGATGVPADAVIVVVFTEAMNQASVEAGWTSPDLPASGVAFGWNAAGDTLTVTPDAPLELAEGVGLDPSVVAARAYAFTIAATAADLAGNPLAAPVTAGFTTSRRLSVDLARIESLTRSMRGDGLVFGDTAVTLTVGDSVADLQYKLFAGFTLPVLPAGAALEAATLSGNQSSIVASPYLLGQLGVAHVNMATIDAAAFAAVPLADIGTISSDATTGVKSIDVTGAFADDLANHAARGERTQYRLEFSSATNSNDAADEARFSRSGVGLRLTYLID